MGSRARQYPSKMVCIMIRIGMFQQQNTRYSLNSKCEKRHNALMVINILLHSLTCICMHYGLYFQLPLAQQLKILLPNYAITCNTVH